MGGGKRGRPFKNGSSECVTWMHLSIVPKKLEMKGEKKEKPKSATHGGNIPPAQKGLKLSHLED